MAGGWWSATATPASARSPTAAGAVAVRAPRVDDRRVDPVTGERLRFRSVILPPWCRKSPKVAEVLPLLYLHGLSTGDFVPALEAFFGSAAGLSAAAVPAARRPGRPTTRPSAGRDLTDRDYVYVGPTGWCATRRHLTGWGGRTRLRSVAAGR